MPVVDPERHEVHPCPTALCDAQADWTNWYVYNSGSPVIEGAVHESAGIQMAHFQCRENPIHYGDLPIPGPGW